MTFFFFLTSLTDLVSSIIRFEDKLLGTSGERESKAAVAAWISPGVLNVRLEDKLPGTSGERESKAAVVP